MTTPDRVVVTSGYYQGLVLLSGLLAEAGLTQAAIEDPGHNLFRGMIQRSGITNIRLPVDAGGARVDELDQNIQLVFLTPSHQYPMGVPLHPSRRRAVCTWASSTGGLIVEDDYDGEFRYDRQSVAALQGAAPDRIIYCGTTSRALGPSLRLGWMALPPDLVPLMVEARRRADLYAPILDQLILADLINRHAYDRHIRFVRQRYRRRRYLLIDRLSTIPALTIHGVPAGLHTLVTFHGDAATEHEVLRHCAASGVALRGLTELHADPSDGPAGLLIGFAASAEHSYPVSLQALHALLEQLLPKLADVDGLSDALNG